MRLIMSSRLSAFFVIQRHQTSRNRTERRPQVMAEHADELIPKQISLRREAIHECRERLIDCLIESPHLGKVGLAVVLV